MEFLFHVARWLHIVSGFVALFILWLPIVTRKGGKVHTRTGWIYVLAMSCVSISAFYMGVYRLTWDPGPDPHAIPFSWFLIFIAILSSATAWYGIRVLRFKRRTAPHRNLIDLLFPAVLILSALAVSVYGWVIHFSLLQYFPIIGVFLGTIQLHYWLSTPKRRSHWAVEHIIGMLSCCIATITAFVVFGAPRLLQVESVSVLLWFLPTIVVVPLIVGFTLYYGKKYDGKHVISK